MAKRKLSWPVWKAYGYIWATGILFILALGGHWILAWYAFVSEQAQHGASPQVGEFIIQTGRDTLENWQSEFLQLIWQVAGLAFLFHLGSPQSKEGDDRKEEKLDELLRLVDEKRAKTIIERLDQKYPRV
jgi:hypothetical protein